MGKTRNHLYGSGAHTVNGPAPYRLFAQLKYGQTAARPQRDTNYLPSETDPDWVMLPVAPCGHLQWGIGGDELHFSSVTPSKDLSAKIYAIMTWLFRAAVGPAMFSIEKVGMPTETLNLFLYDQADIQALNAIIRRMDNASDSMAEMGAICGEVRP